MFFSRLPVTIVLLAVTAVWSHPFVDSTNPWNVLARGNQDFRDHMSSNHSGFLKDLVDNGQHPPFTYFGCADSRVSESTVFNSLPGQLFTMRNIANQYHSTDVEGKAALAYSVSHLGVQHVIVMGHYGCGGVAAAISGPPAGHLDEGDLAIHAAVSSIRQLYKTSNRAEIVKLRQKSANPSQTVPPEIYNAGFKALVEENVKASVSRIAKDSVITDRYRQLAHHRRASDPETPVPVFVHGLVYNLEIGEVKNLDVSVGPRGASIPPVPFAKVT